MSSAALEQDDNLLELQLANDNFDKTLPQVLNVSKLLTNELHLIETKEKQLSERFKSQLDEYKKAKKQLQLLEEAHKEHTEITADLSRDLECISEELDQIKKKLDDKAGSVTDSSALVEIRTATERLRNENKELDIRIGILDYELIQARMIEANSQQHDSYSNDDSGEESDDGNDSLG